MRTVLGRSPRCAERFARNGFRALKATTMKCKRASAPVRPQAKQRSMTCSNWASNATMTSGFGRKGAAPLGRRFFLANWEMDKNIYQNGFFTVKLGPFIDSGAVADSSGLFGSQGWLWDTGAQCKVRVLGSLTIVLSYGRDLRGGRNVFYGTVLR